MPHEELFAVTRRRLADAVAAHAPVAFSTSFGAEDMVILDLIDGAGLPVDVFTLDTGRLPEETYALMQTSRERYRTPIHVYFPDAAEIEDFVARNGINAFYDSVSMRERCCEIRKVRPLARALAGKALWVTGLRREQSVAREATPILAFDDSRGLMKHNPLADWTGEDVWAYVRGNNVPYNSLHDRGYPSIGCAPCTRAVLQGEDPRAGRWWWEQGMPRECGIHMGPDGRMIRTPKPATAAAAFD